LVVEEVTGVGKLLGGSPALLGLRPVVDAATGAYRRWLDPPIVHGVGEGELCRILSALDRASVRYWVAGGWGVDALVGQRTREHRDVDLAIDAEDFARAGEAVKALGYVAETDWLPTRLEFAGPGGWVDLHPVTFGPGGDGVLAGPNGEEFSYPALDLVVGGVAGHRVPCISARLQREFHAGYVPRPQDMHDLALLDALP
jgi:lincosamide nucleotidyltransferase A/C/D/E